MKAEISWQWTEMVNYISLPILFLSPLFLLFPFPPLPLPPPPSGFSDPYIIVKYGIHEMYRTSVVSKSLNPKWNCHCTLSAPPPDTSIVVVSYMWHMYLPPSLPSLPPSLPPSLSSLSPSLIIVCVIVRSAGTRISSQVMISWDLSHLLSMIWNCLRYSTTIWYDHSLCLSSLQSLSVSLSLSLSLSLSRMALYGVHCSMSLPGKYF